uniref:Acylamino-acid-releasing enzyme n=1 Tax=Amphiprion percula TaxID=161767 RepID=A0A3P8SY59_AMPPE
MEPRQVIGLFGQLSGFPTPVGAHVTEEQLEEVRIYRLWGQSDLVRGSRLRFSQQWTLIADSNNHRTIRTVLPPGTCVLLSSRSPVQHLRAVLKDISGHHLLEVWDHHGLTKCFNLTTLNNHGRVYEDAQFGCLSWSLCENKLLYVAEKSKNSSGEDLDGESGDRSVYWEDWGEALTNKSVPVICAVDLQNDTVAVLQGIPADVSPGQALWAPDSQSVFFIGWYHEPFRLGLKFCFNRRSALFRLDLDGSCERLSGENLSVSCPRLSPDGSTLVYLQGAMLGPHSQCLSLQQVLMMLDLSSRRTSTLLDVVSRPQPGEFAGVYEALPSCCWSADSQKVIFSSAQNSHALFFLILYRSSGKMIKFADLSDPSQVYGSWKLLTVQRDLMVVSCSSPNTPPTLRVGFLPAAGEAVTWRTLQEPIMTFDFQWSVLDVSPPPEEDNNHYSVLDFGAVLVKPSRPLGETRTPLVVFIHGGPHSQFPAEWNFTTAGLVKLGLAVLMVNYRGSTGFGQDSILSLIGQIGNQDVKDVQRAVLTALQTHASLDSKRLAVIGGSHGGFLSCHLIGQYPDFYRACAVRNPVINAATLLGTSDIVDWRYTSAGFPFSYDQIPSAEALAAMLHKSPISYAAQIKAPVLLMLGGRDRRVSPHQGLELYKALKSRGSPVRLLWFPEDGHSLSRVDTQEDCFLNTVLWLKQHL